MMRRFDRRPAPWPVLRFSFTTPEHCVSPEESAPVRVLDDASRLGEGAGARFSVVVDGLRSDAFVVRYRGGLYAYLNTCRHELLPLDFGDGRFFDDDYDALVCCHHGARYRPETGECICGPCEGGRLTPLALEERNGALWCTGVRRGKPAGP